MLQAPLAEEITALTRRGGNLAGAASPPACEVIFDHHGMVAERVLELELARPASADLPRQCRASVRCRSAGPQQPGMPSGAADTGATGQGQAAPALTAGGSHHLGMQSVAAGTGAVGPTQAAPVTTDLATVDQAAAESLREGRAAAAHTVKPDSNSRPAAESAGETACEGSTSTEAKLLQGQRERMPESAHGGAGQVGGRPARAALEPEPLDICSEHRVTGGAGIEQGRQTVAAPVEVTDLSAAPGRSGNASRPDAQPVPVTKEASVVPTGEQAGGDAQTTAEERISAAKGMQQLEAGFALDTKASSLTAILAAPKTQSVQIADEGGKEMTHRAAFAEASEAMSLMPKLEDSASSTHAADKAVASASPSSSGASVALAAADPQKPSTGSVSGSLTEPASRRSPDPQSPFQQVCRLPQPPSRSGATIAPPGFRTTATTNVFAGHKAHNATACFRFPYPQQPSRIPRPTANLTNQLPGAFREPSVAATADVAGPPSAVPRQSGTLKPSVLATAETGGPPTMLARGSSKLESEAATTALRIPFLLLPAMQPAAASEPALLPQPAGAWPMLAGQLSAEMASAPGLTARPSAEVAQSNADAPPAPKSGPIAAAVVAAAASTPPAEAEWKLSGQLSASGKDTASVTRSAPMQGWLLLGLAVQMTHNHVCLLTALRECHYKNMVRLPAWMS